MTVAFFNGGTNMNKKQKKVLQRIIVALICIIALEFIDVEGYLEFG